MELIFKEVKQFITPEFVVESSNKFMVDENTLTSLSDSILAGIFGALLAKGDNSPLEKVLVNFASHFGNTEDIKICSFEESAFNTIDAIISLEKTILMDKRGEFISLLAQTSNVPEAHVEKLMSSIVYVTILYLGRKLITDEYTITGLLAQIHAERNFFLGYIPFGLTSLFGLPSLLAIGNNLSSDAKVVSHTIYYEVMYSNTPVEEERKGLWNWFAQKIAL